jgi:arylsulfatase A-like enzyme
MLTGKIPFDHRVFRNGQKKLPAIPTITKHLRAAGYKTGGFISGAPLKSHLCGLDEGFQTYDDRLALVDFLSETFSAKLIRSALTYDLSDIFPESLRGFVSKLSARGVYRQAKEVTDPSLRWLEKNYHSPFFLFIHYYDPHYPYGRKAALRYRKRPLIITAKPQDIDQQKRLYGSEIESVDDQIRRVVHFLKQKRIYDQTLLIITSDHGESLGEHNYYYDHERYVYEQLVRVPLIIRYPVLIPSGCIVQSQVALLDLYGTLLTATGLEVSPDTDRPDLISAAKAPAANAKRMILSHHFYYGVDSLRSDNWKIIRTRTPTELKYELYDLSNDPGELNNLSQIRHVQFQNARSMLLKALHSAGEIRKFTAEDQKLSSEEREALQSLGYFR